MLSNLLDYIPDGVFTVDAEWRVTFFNRAAEQITGIKRAEAVGRRCCDVFRASICENACALKQTLSTNRPVVNKVVYIIDARGQKIPISISTAALKDDRGRIVGGVESFRDLRRGRGAAPRTAAAEFLFRHHWAQRGDAADF